MGDAEIDLAPRVRVEVEPGPALLDRQRIGARGDGLGLERLRQPVARHLRRDDAVEVGLEPDDVDGAQGSVRNGDLHLAAVRAVAEPEGRRAGVERERSGSCCALGDVARLDAAAPARRSVGPAARCQSWPIPSRTVNGDGDATRQPRAALREVHAHPRHGRLAERRSLVVVGEDLVVESALLRVPVRAPLRHADAVAPSAAADDEDRASREGTSDARACSRGTRRRHRRGATAATSAAKKRGTSHVGSDFRLPTSVS